MTISIPLHRIESKGRQRWGVTAQQLLQWHADTFSKHELTTAKFMESHRLATLFLRCVFGVEWIEDVFEKGRFGDFITKLSLETTREERIMIVHRVVDLAEMIFNLQVYQGIEYCLDLIHGGKIEHGYSELMSAKILANHGVKFSFNEPKKLKGRDFDLNVVFQDGTIGCADTKCKIEGSEFSYRTVNSSLDTARKQFPNNLPGVVMLKVPVRWLSSETSEKLRFVSANFFNGTKRVVCVVFYGTAFEFSSESLAYNDGTRYRQFVSFRNRFGDKFNPRLIAASNDTSKSSSNWFRFWNAFHPLKRVVKRETFIPRQEFE